jgi:hypothetical protein
VSVIYTGSTKDSHLRALTENNFAWNVKIPASLAAGSYVLRHEIIGLHSAGSPNGAQAYPQVSVALILFFAK